MPADTGPSRTAADRLRAFVRALAFSLVPLLVLLLLAELALRVTGLGDPDAHARLARGFDRDARYLVPDGQVPGAWRTQMFDGANTELFIPPKGERTRVLLFGGSNTIAFPERTLQELLDRARPSPGWEVVNLGRPGYGSERVSILLEQAMALEPDVVLIYSGHNEFVEHGFAMELAEAWGGPGAEGLARALSRLRLVNVLTDLLARGRAAGGKAPDQGAADAGGPGRDVEAATADVAPRDGLPNDGGPTDATPADGAPADGTTALVDRGDRPEVHEAARETFWGLTYDQTLLFYDVYRDNLRAMVDTAHAHGVQVMLCTVIGNMLSQPAVAADPRDALSEETLRRHTYLVDRALRRLPRRAVECLMRLPGGGPPARPHWYDWGQVIRGAAGRGEGPHEGRPPPPPLRTLRPPFGGGPFWADPSGWSDEVDRLVRCTAALHQRRLSEDERRDVLEARGLLEEVLVLMPSDSLSRFALGLCHYLLGDDARAVASLKQAAVLDLAPNRGNDLTNGVVRALAAERPDVLLFDAEALAAGACPSGLIGYELMVDNCHLHAGALPVLMELFVPGLVQLAER